MQRAAVDNQIVAETAGDIITRHVFFKPEQDQGWKSQPEMPSPEEILSSQTDVEGLPINPVDVPWETKDAYLAAQYQILRREAVEGLRFSVRSFITACEDGEEMADDDFTCIYTDVFIKLYLLARIGPIARVEFSTKRSKFAIKWQQSRRLVPGTIVAISTREDNFKTICKVATIAQRPFRGGLDQDPPLVDIMWANPEDAVFDPDLELVMIESRNGYYESTRHALIGLQHAAGTDSPLDKYLTGVHTADTPPAFILENPIMNLSSICHSTSDENQATADALSEYDVLRGGIPNIGEMTTLDKSQLSGLHRIISKELAIVQGPPGTGKTFTSIEAIKVIIATRRLHGGPPLIVSAQTNHALDQLLNLCLDSEATIVRVGGRTESPRVEEHTMYELRQRCHLPINSRFKSLEASRQNNIKKIDKLIQETFTDKLLDPGVLLQINIITQAQHDSLLDDDLEGDNVGGESLGPFQTWLGDALIPAQVRRNRYPSQREVADETSKLLTGEYEFDGDLDNIAYDEEDQNRIQGIEIQLTHCWTGKDPDHMLSWQRKVAHQLGKTNDLFKIVPSMRGAVYQYLQGKLLAAVTPQFTALVAENVEFCKRIKANKWLKDTELILSKRIDVVGCTTTGLTKYRGFIAALQPRSLLIEEAAESREANITSALYPSIQQLILIGDHQQLAPRCDIQWLGEEPFNLNVSLFQRMITLRMKYDMLIQQRRMKPELRLILSSFYPELIDHDIVKSTANRPDVPGMGGYNSWYFDHMWPEGADSENSKFNEQEAQMISNFFAYLVSNGVLSAKITILTFYNGQRKRILSKLKKHGSLIGMTFNVVTVDSYQGEENDIVLLSLVRSPGDMSPAPRPSRGPLPGGEQSGTSSTRRYAAGFLSDQRRAVVAISRARCGFYVFGNIDNLLYASTESFEVWVNIWNAFANQERVKRQKGLPLTCQQHQKEIWIKEVDDWGDNAGGCDQQCEQSRPCGHKCILKCHRVPHDRLPCGQPCHKNLGCGHGCQRLCGQECYCDCRKFHGIHTQNEVEKQRHAQEQALGLARAKAEDRMTIEQRLLQATSQPSVMVRAEANRHNQKARQPMTKTGPGNDFPVRVRQSNSSGSMLPAAQSPIRRSTVNRSASVSNVGDYGGSSSRGWSEVGRRHGRLETGSAESTNNGFIPGGIPRVTALGQPGQSNEPRKPPQSRWDSVRYSSESKERKSKDEPKEQKIIDIYQPTTLIEGRRIDDGMRLVHQHQLKPGDSSGNQAGDGHQRTYSSASVQRSGNRHGTRSGKKIPDKGPQSGLEGVEQGRHDRHDRQQTPPVFQLPGAPIPEPDAVGWMSYSAYQGLKAQTATSRVAPTSSTRAPKHAPAKTGTNPSFTTHTQHNEAQDVSLLIPISRDDTPISPVSNTRPSPLPTPDFISGLPSTPIDLISADIPNDKPLTPPASIISETVEDKDPKTENWLIDL
ncbi:P-loop containing nucleoside triphosphate hydrolase protein [Bombardia bombarda]|uniref:P-loop containing nucleoside triphosphate hydrolase protein n=1 Tax=Bombardia bombarda TaxID=252184 RepID=A0AA39X7T1_9PEZI|nr:P-loop containing nucleoside triphosphate hydrolase protein [Bombardia bombarda]